MAYRIQADLSFPDFEHFNAVWNVIKAQFPHTVTLSPGTMTAEPSVATWHACQHDVDPISPCVNMESYTSPLD